jgi:hypothetical protein
VSECMICCMTDRAPLTDHNALVAPTLAEQAQAAQLAWAVTYARTHRVKRSAAWLASIILSSLFGFCAFRADTVDSFTTKLADTGCASYGPLILAYLASLPQLFGGKINRIWIFFWLFLSLDIVIGAAIFGESQYLTGTFCIADASSIGTILALALRVPNDPAVNWETVRVEKLTLVRTARGGQRYEEIISGYRDAEEISASWMRRFGYRDARTTPIGPDNGIDVWSTGAIAQVKYWTSKRVGIKEVQRLAGTISPGQIPYFFAGSGYTRPAIQWAGNSDNQIRLFILQSDGNLIACNYQARRTLWSAREHTPSAHSRPLPFWLTFPASLFCLADSLLLGYASIEMFLHGPIVLAISFALMAIALFAVAVFFSAKPLGRMARNLRQGKPINLRGSFTFEEPDPDSGLPSDYFTGYEKDFMVNVHRLTAYLGTRYRAIKRRIPSRH